MTVPVGSVEAGDMTSTWQNDGNKLRLTPGPAGGQPTVGVAFEAQQIGTIGPLSALTINFSVNGQSNDEDAKWTVRVQTFNFDTSQWVTAGQVEVTTTETVFSVAPPSDPNAYVDEVQRLHTRFQIRQSTDSGPWRFAFDGLNIFLEKEPG